MLGVARGADAASAALMILYAVLFGTLALSLAMSASWRSSWLRYARRRRTEFILGTIPVFVATLLGSRLVGGQGTVGEYLLWYLGGLGTLAIPVVVTLRWIKRVAPEEWARSFTGENYSPEFNRRFRRFLWLALIPWILLACVIAALVRTPF